MPAFALSTAAAPAQRARPSPASYERHACYASRPAEELSSRVSADRAPNARRARFFGSPVFVSARPSCSGFRHAAAPFVPAVASQRVVPGRDMREVYRALADELLAKMPAEGKYIVAIAGAPGSGKSTTAGAVCELVNAARPGSAVVFPMDGFHLYRRELDLFPDPAQAHARRGSPWTFNPEKLVAVLRKLRADGAVKAPSFDHGVGDPVEEDIEITPAHRVVLLEGNYVLLDEPHWRDIGPLVDDTWYIDVDVDAAMERVVRRHMAAWGVDEGRARARADSNDRPNALLIAATKPRASTVVPSLPL
eukprot:tig00021352_g20677.t1